MDRLVIGTRGSPLAMWRASTSPPLTTRPHTVHARRSGECSPRSSAVSHPTHSRSSGPGGRVPQGDAAL